MPASAADPAPAPNRSRWMRQGRECMAARDWAGAIRAYGQGLLEQPLLGMHYAANLERARSQFRQERRVINHRGPAHTQVVVAAAELSHNAAGRAFTLAQLYQHLGHPVALLGSHFPQWGRELWQPIQTAVIKAQLPLHTFVAEHEPRYVEQAWQLVLQHPADLVHLSKPRLPAVVIGLLYKLLWGAAVLVDIDDEELCFVGEREPITLDGLKRLCHGLPEPRELMGPLWTRLAVDLAQRFDGTTVANGPLQERYGGTVIPHARDPEQLRPATAAEKVAARQRFGVPLAAKVVLFFGTPKRHKGLLPLAEAVAQLPQALQPLLVVAGGFAPEDAALQRELEALLPAQRLVLLGNQPFEQAAQVLALADLVVLLSEGEVAAFQSPAKLSDALAMGLPVLVSEAAPLRPLVEQGWVWAADPQGLGRQLEQLLSDAAALQAQGQRARLGFEATLATPAVAPHLQRVAQQALADPKPADGRMINALESLHHRISSPLMAHRYRQWSERRIDWQVLQLLERDPGLVSIVVPVYGDPAELDGCLESVRQATTRWRWELIAVMNDDAADSRAVLERHAQADGRIRAIWPGENVQFALGCNLGFAASRGGRVVFLNNDCRVQAGWLDALMASLDDPAVAAVQPRLMKPDGTVQCLGVFFRKGQILGEPLFAGLDGELICCKKNYHLQAVTGACMGVRAKDFSKLHGFDAGYLNSQEDIDICMRLLKLRGRGICMSTATTSVIHNESKAPGRFYHTHWSRHWFTRTFKGQTRDDETILSCSDKTKESSLNKDDMSAEINRFSAKMPSSPTLKTQSTTAIVIHVFYPELWPVISGHLLKLDIDFDVHVTCWDARAIDISKTVYESIPEAKIHPYPNEGMDTLPFMRLLPLLQHSGYKLVCKLHTKRGVDPLGATWRKYLFEKLVGSPSTVRNLVRTFDQNPSLILAGPSALYLSALNSMYGNRPILEILAKRLNIQTPFNSDWGFFAGSMLWSRVDAFMPLAEALIDNNELANHTHVCASNGDGGLPHALERALGLIPQNGSVALLTAKTQHPRPESSDRINIEILKGKELSQRICRQHPTHILRILHEEYKHKKSNIYY